MVGSEQFLITGGTGFIGRYVVRKLLTRGARVRLFCRAPEKAHRLFGDRVGVVVGDLCDPGSAAHACRGVSTVIHVGGVYRFGRRARRELFEVNVRGTEHMLAAARAARVERFVHISSNSVLTHGGALVKEQDFPRSVSSLEPYRCSKWLAELAVLEAARQGLPVIIASPSSPLGAEDETPTPTGQIIQDFLAGRFSFTARVALNFIDVGEVADGIVAVAEKGKASERYLLGHHNVWLDEFLALAARCVGRPAPAHRLQLALVAIAGGIGELAGSERVCWETGAHARRFQWLDCRKAKEELGWHPSVPLETCVRESIEWFVRRSIHPIPNLPELAKANVAAR
jgi:dihydroflavonol-4-reductase